MQKILRRSSAWFVGVALLIGSAFADQTATDSTAKAKELTRQTNCPVMGGKIDSAAYSNIQGQRVYHCCNGCQKKLAADPDKYFKMTAEQGILFENIQKRCPVSGKALTTKEIYTDYEGRRVFFSDKDCLTKFSAEPAKYLKILGQQTKEDYPEKSAAKSDHSGHDH